MKIIYPVVFTKIPEGYAVSVPDLEIDTHGHDLSHAMDMARDAMGLVGITKEDASTEFPQPTDINTIESDTDDIVSLVDVDLTDYRKANERRTVRRNVTLPSWLDYQASKAGINVSAVLQKALKQELSL
ncbi:MAG: type II toxin-antitoxin system HicB family antitoxin [Clostridiales Family XIII bacterium]|jgi:predicted RNase H-like HicB family nuclease|nr:type II toxin-antitoxin system HicB family antitoxin [Clostridiales Family XIII bacterium]